MKHSCPWDGYTKDLFPFCEEQLCQFVSQPANTWSNIGYFLAAWWLWKHSKTTNMRSFSLIAFSLAIGSTLFHMSGTLWAKYLDVGAMLMLSSCCLSLSLARWQSYRPIVSYLIFGALTVHSFFTVNPGHAGGTLFLVHSVVTMGLEVWLWHKRQKPPGLAYLKQVMWLLPLAFALNIMDQHGPLCWPRNHFFTFHGLWHLMTAWCIWRIAQYYDAFNYENPKKSS